MRPFARTIGLLLCACTLGLAPLLAGPLAAPAAADAGDPLDYNGGPVVHSVTGVIVEWGPNINSLYTNPTTGDPGLIKYFAAQSGSPDDDGGVLAQYMDTSGLNSANQVAYGGEYEINPSVAGTRLQDSQVATELVQQIQAGNLPAPTGDGLSNVYLLLFPAGTTICDDDGCSGQEFCSYHASTQLPDGTNVLYDVLPDNTSGSMTEGCGTLSTLRNQTMYLSHEWAESINDPLVDDATQYAPPLAWYDANCPTSTSLCGEVADKCNQETTTEGGWTVQLLWSNIDDACVGSEPRYGLPSVSFSSPAGLTAGQPANWQASAADPPGNSTSAAWDGHEYAIQPGIASVSWNWGDGTPPSDGTQTVHTFASPGIYTVTATATDNLGFSSQTSQTVAAWGPLGPPAAQTGAAADVTQGAALVTGAIDAVDLPVQYRFDYGTAADALATSTTDVNAPTSSAPNPVGVTLTGLAPGTTYFYRLDVLVDGQTLPGAVQSFTTTRAKARRRGGAVARVASAGSRHHRRRRHAARRHAAAARRLPTAVGHERSAIQASAGGADAVPVSAHVVGGQTLAAALSHGLLVSFDCARACRVSLQATLAPRGRLGADAVPRVLAAGAGETSARSGTGAARLRFSSSARAWLARMRSATFAVSGFRS